MLTTPFLWTASVVLALPCQLLIEEADLIIVSDLKFINPLLHTLIFARGVFCML